ncbi:MAG: TraR/DksA C4-type zinc finger protein [Candidatus Paceibacterota bacterium]
MPLNKDQIEKLEIREKLEEEKEKIQAQLKSLKKGLDFGNDVDSGDEEADEAEEYSNYIGVEKTLNHRMQDIDKALNKIKEGTYGLCEKCEKRIGIEVLKVAPESILCKDCKKRN